jgi:hypothetical protein
VAIEAMLKKVISAGVGIFISLLLDVG